ncbi:flagellar basal body-associated protein FliL [Glaciecola sp. 1036]|uniref:flagellar basal body-associated protein FliL n=1 Tax=Alteromonadaceae TaxID=72275 RepID=UPI003D013CFC
MRSTWAGCFAYMFVLAILVLLNSPVSAQEEEEGEESAKPSYAYIALEPDIITNYVSDNSKRLGYLRVTIEIMLADPANIPNVEHHMPLLRATAIEIIGAQTDQNIRSLTGRENIRRSILKSFKDIMVRETGKETVRDVIFTKYLRQGG